MQRRTFLTASSLALVSGKLLAAADPVRYPHPGLVTLDPSFTGFLGNTPISRIYTNPNMYWAEGPAWNGVGNYLVWSDIPNNIQ